MDGWKSGGGQKERGSDSHRGKREKRRDDEREKLRDREMGGGSKGGRNRLAPSTSFLQVPTLCDLSSKFIQYWSLVFFIK